MKRPKFKRTVIVPVRVEVRGTSKREFNRALTNLLRQRLYGLSDVMYGYHVGMDPPEAYRLLGIQNPRDIKRKYRL